MVCASQFWCEVGSTRDRSASRCLSLRLIAHLFYNPGIHLFLANSPKSQQPELVHAYGAFFCVFFPALKSVTAPKEG